MMQQQQQQFTSAWPTTTSSNPAVCSKQTTVTTTPTPLNSNNTTTITTTTATTDTIIVTNSRSSSNSDSIAIATSRGRGGSRGLFGGSCGCGGGGNWSSSGDSADNSSLTSHARNCNPAATDSQTSSKKVPLARQKVDASSQPSRGRVQRRKKHTTSGNSLATAWRRWLSGRSLSLARDSGQKIDTATSAADPPTSSILASENKDCEEQVITIETSDELPSAVSESDGGVLEASEEERLETCRASGNRRIKRDSRDASTAAALQGEEVEGVASCDAQCPEKRSETTVASKEINVKVAFCDVEKKKEKKDDIKIEIQTTEAAREQSASATPTTTTNTGIIKKLLIKRQQSYDSYKTSREMKQKMRLNIANQQQAATSAGKQHQQQQQQIARRRKYSVSSQATRNVGVAILSQLKGAQKDAIAALGAVAMSAAEKEAAAAAKLNGGIEESEEVGVTEESNTKTTPLVPKKPQPPTSLSLSPANSSIASTKLAANSSAFVVGNFAGSITPTYATHHLPSSKYHLPTQQQRETMNNAKKFSNASSTFSSQHCDSLCTASFGQNSTAASNATLNLTNAGNATPATSPGQLLAAGADDEKSIQCQVIDSNNALDTNMRGSALESAVSIEAAEAARRAHLAEHIYDNKCGLGEDMKFLASLPELCDITFLVGETREPVCAVKSVLAARSRVFHKILFGNNAASLMQANQLVDNMDNSGNNQRANNSMRTTGARASADSWAVIADASGTDLVSRHRRNSPSSASSQHSLDRGVSGKLDFSRASSPLSASNFGGGSRSPLIVGPGHTVAPAGKQKGRAKLGRRKSKAERSLSRMFTSSTATPASTTSAGKGGFGLSENVSQVSKQQQRKALHATQNLAHANTNLLDKMSKSQTSTTMIIEEFEPDVFRQLIEYMHTGCVLLQARTLLGLLNAADYYGLDALRKSCLRFVSCCITVDTVCSLLSTAERYVQYKCTKSILQKVLEFVDTHANEVFKLNAFGLLPEHVVRLILARDNLVADELIKYNAVYTWCEHYCRQFELTSIADVMINFIDFIQLHKIPTNVLITEIYPARVVPDVILMRALAHQADPESFEAPASHASTLRRMTLPNLAQATPANSKRGQQQNQKLKRKPSQFSKRNNNQEGVVSDSSKRKGSLAQVSINNVKRFSSKLSMRAKRAHALMASTDATLSSGGVAASQPTSSKKADRDAMAIGRQVVDAFLAQHARQLRERQALEARQSAGEAGASKGALQARSETLDENQQQVLGLSSHQAVKRVLTSPCGASFAQDGGVGSAASSRVGRRSFKNLRQISRMLSRLSPSLVSKTNSIEASNPSSSTVTGNSRNSLVGVSSGNTKVSKNNQQNSKSFKNLNEKQRKFKRSETVFESSTSTQNDFSVIN